MMRQVEARFGEPLEDLLPRLYQAFDQKDMARHLGVDPATVNRWLRLLDVPTNRRKLKVLPVHPFDGEGDCATPRPPSGGETPASEGEAA